MLRNRGSRFDTGWLVTFSFFFILVEKNLLRNFLSVAKMAKLVYERENCPGERRQVIYQTRATVFHRDIQTPRRELKIRRAAEYF